MSKENSNITDSMAREFWRDLMGTIYKGKRNCGNSGVMSTGLIADYMYISTEKANDFLRKCCQLGLTERQGGGWVV